MHSETGLRLARIESDVSEIRTHVMADIAPRLTKVEGRSLRKAGKYAGVVTLVVALAETVRQLWLE
jgi:hypothetical protein